ncbi:carboxylating nicotinate-nucleotide diphosphorylase [Alicyclobacillus acidoterrestris]|nr:carboxylating nicotinate-nucleotide diphosphorylase [Alicyclobacillus acidoterrestris]EPZ46128.1 hypothetical protein N007_07570 [Alicyclobacillus acidoterrestris ATCC 49025]
MMNMGLTRDLIRLALREDIGRGDCTTEAIIPTKLQAMATVYVKEAAIVAGLPVMEAVFEELGGQVRIAHLVEDGQEISGKTAVCRMTGSARHILMGERTALNFLSRLTGIATFTRMAVRELVGTHAKLLDTRKTTPGWRSLEKYAVRTGGGYNHRFGLDDMVLIKDNHIALSGGIRQAVARARAKVGLAQKIEVEVDTLRQLQEALDTDADMILLDNMAPDVLREAVQLVAGRVPLEASGNVNLETLAKVAQSGIDYISMGALTHSATSVDVGLDIVFE